LQVTTPGYENRFLRHADGLGFTEVVTSGSAGGLKQDATFRVRTGLADSSCYSFESRNFPGHYLRHANFRIHKEPRDGSSLFDEDATFCVRPALDGSARISLESKNMSGYYIRHRNGEVWLDLFDNSEGYRQDATWQAARPLWRSTTDLPVNSLHSLQVTTPGYTNRFARHMENLGYTEVVDNGGSALLKKDATFRIVPGLADSSCYSFESLNYPNNYLRHASFRVRKDPRDGTPLFDSDATFCAQPGLAGGGVSFQALAFPDYYMRHAFGAIWISTFGDDRNPGESEASFNADATWNVVAPWAS
jgi:hypothetical protein